MMLLWLPGRPVAHLASWVGRGWRSRCYRVQAAYDGAERGMLTEADWRGEGGGRPAELQRAHQLPAGMRVCATCLRSYASDDRQLQVLLERTGQAGA